MINGHGNNIYEYEGRICHDFSSNIAFNKKADDILNFLKENINSIKNYPDPEAKILTQKIADYHGVSPQCVMVTNGSAEAFYLVAHLFKETKTAICIPAFSEYEDACNLYKHSCSFVPVTEFKDRDFSSFKSVWLGNPNNPDGTLTQGKDIIKQCQTHDETFFIVDYAYMKLTSRKTEIEIVESMPKNLIQIHSLTKLFGIPGIRLGYVIAPSKIITELSSMRPPWSVNSMALDAGRYIMDNYNMLTPDLQELTEESLFLQERLSENQLIEVYPSSCNFFLLRLKDKTAKWLKDELIEKSGILIRDASNFRGLDERYFRLSAQTRKANNKLITDINNML